MNTRKIQQEKSTFISIFLYTLTLYVGLYISISMHLKMCKGISDTCSYMQLGTH